MKKRVKVYDRVKAILEDIPEARDSDTRLVWEYAKQTGLLTLNNHFVTYNSFLKLRFETIRRSRQKIQEHYEHLRSSAKMAKLRRQVADTKGMFVYQEVER